MILRLAALSFLAVAALAVDAAADFRAAMASGDATAKKAALRTLAGSSLSDDEALPLLVQAVADRQVGEDAVQALRGRTKLSPPNRRGASAYPAYPGSDDAAGWSAWLAARSEAVKQKAALEATRKEVDKNKAAIAGITASGAATASGAVTASGAASASSASVAASGERPRWIPPPELGRPDRILLKSGGSVLAYIQSKRQDADGHLLSVRIVHPENGGEETLAAELIARIEEDVR